MWPNADQLSLNAILLWSPLGVTTLALVVGSGAVAWERHQFTAGFTTGVASEFLTGVVTMC
jgi:hypothetical protein